MKKKTKKKNKQKNQFWVRYPYIGCQNLPLDYFWAKYFCISETQRCSNKRKKCKIASGFLLLGENTGPKKLFCEPRPLSFGEVYRWIYVYGDGSAEP